MIDKLYEKITWISSIVVLVLMGVFAFKMCVSGPKMTQDLCSKEMKSKFHGKIIDIVKVPNNPKCKYIVLDNRQKILQPYTFGLWMQVDIGDSIVKMEGTLDYIIYRKMNDYRKDTIHHSPCK